MTVPTRNGPSKSLPAVAPLFRPPEALLPHLAREPSPALTTPPHRSRIATI